MSVGGKRVYRLGDALVRAVGGSYRVLIHSILIYFCKSKNGKFQIETMSLSKTPPYPKVLQRQCVHHAADVDRAVFPEAKLSRCR